ncbi:hypothetical protein NIES4073_28460 [Kalymmatonema gypsitolerans NIES-4073]|nr:hypothetical protein NIES4073_28460 [Scytonema sp. NIES-4073]
MIIVMKPGSFPAEIEQVSEQIHNTQNSAVTTA